MHRDGSFGSHSVNYTDHFSGGFVNHPAAQVAETGVGLNQAGESLYQQVACPWNTWNYSERRALNLQLRLSISTKTRVSAWHINRLQLSRGAGLAAPVPHDVFRPEASLSHPFIAPGPRLYEIKGQ